MTENRQASISSVLDLKAIVKISQFDLSNKWFDVRSRVVHKTCCCSTNMAAVTFVFTINLNFKQTNCVRSKHLETIEMTAMYDASFSEKPHAALMYK